MRPPLRGAFRLDPRTKRLTYSGRQINLSFFAPRPSGHHRAVDLPALDGEIQQAMEAGTVTHVGWLGAYGRAVIMLGASGREYVYPHLKLYLVKRGQRVAEGQSLGRTGCSGNCSGPHEHLEIRLRAGDRTTCMDPYWLVAWLAQGRATKVNPYPRPSSSGYKRGAIGYPVLWIEWATKGAAPNGVFDAAVEARVKAFQRANGIRATGVCDTATIRKLALVTR